MHTPTLTPIKFNAGWDWKLLEANGLEPKNTRSDHASVFIVWWNGSWVVTNGIEGVSLFRPQDPGEPLTFAYGTMKYERCDSPESALALVSEYLNQPVNPYLWIREHADQKA